MRLASSSPDGHSAVARRRALPFTRWLTIGAILLLAIAGCDGSDEPAERPIEDFGETLALEDFTSLGLKRNKTYTTDEMPAVQEAYMGFYTAPGDGPAQVELRFFASHADAVNTGTKLVDEATGPDAVTLEDEVTVKEGYKDRVTGQTIDVGPRPRYMDYVILNNVIVMCEGLDSAQSLERCAALTDPLKPDS